MIIQRLDSFHYSFITKHTGLIDTEKFRKSGKNAENHGISTKTPKVDILGTLIFFIYFLAFLVAEAKTGEVFVFRYLF